MPPPSKDMRHRLTVDAGEEDDWDVWDIRHSGKVKVWSSLHEDLSSIQDKCFLSYLDFPDNAGSVFPTALQVLNTIGEHCETL